MKYLTWQLSTNRFSLSVSDSISFFSEPGLAKSVSNSFFEKLLVVSSVYDILYGLNQRLSIVFDWRRAWRACPIDDAKKQRSLAGFACFLRLIPVVEMTYTTRTKFMRHR